MIRNFLKEFKDFALKGNVFDMAIGIIIGGAFSKIVSSLVNDLIMPIFGFLIGSQDISKLAFKVQKFGTTEAKDLISISYGNFLSVVLDFLIIAFCIFMVIKIANRLRKKPEVTPVVTAQVVSKELALLTEIRDLLKLQHETH